jgi:hypothetical protein
MKQQQKDALLSLQESLAAERSRQLQELEDRYTCICIYIHVCLLICMFIYMFNLGVRNSCGVRGVDNCRNWRIGEDWIRLTL